MECMEQMVKEVGSTLVEHMAEMDICLMALQPNPACGNLGSGTEDGGIGPWGYTRLARSPLRSLRILDPVN